MSRTLILPYAAELQVIKAVRLLNPDLDLREAKGLVDAYGVVSAGISRRRAEEI